MKIQVLTNVRLDTLFLGLWVRYYGGIFGRENLHIFVDGDDWQTSVDLSGINIHLMTDVPRTRVRMNRVLARRQARLAAQLLKSGTDLVLRTDVDEYVAADPNTGFTLTELLETAAPDAQLAALGIDMMHLASDGELDRSKPILTQRRHGVITREYCKLVALRKPCRWSNGYHRGLNTPINIQPGLLLFHLALMDRGIATERQMERAVAAQDPTLIEHVAGRMAVLEGFTDVPALGFDDVWPKARRKVMQSLPSKTGPHPGRIDDGNVERGYLVRLPDRMLNLLPVLAERAPTPEKPQATVAVKEFDLV